jgi:hypothetical protein
MTPVNSSKFHPVLIRALQRHNGVVPKRAPCCALQVGVEVCAWITMVVNVFWFCATFIGFGYTNISSMLLMFHAIVGIIIGADLKVASHSENARRFRTFLIANVGF